MTLHPEGVVQDPAPQTGGEGPVAETPVNFLFPVFNQDGVEELLAQIAPRLRPGDGVIVVTGNNDRELDLAWLQGSVTRIHADLPGVKVYAMTAGLEHVRRVRDSGITGIEGVVYDYENHYPNEPEFTWDFATTIANVQEFAGLLKGTELKSVLLPTGQPLLRGWLQKRGWDYAALGGEVDMQIIQTQTYCKSSEFPQAIEKAASQHSALGMGTGRWMPQVTVDTKSPNGVVAEVAAECMKHAADAGHSGAMVWWSPYRTEEALKFLDLVGR